jgi:hypothetical protein
MHDGLQQIAEPTGEARSCLKRLNPVQPPTPVLAHLLDFADWRIASHTRWIWRVVRKVGSVGGARLDAVKEIGDRMHDGVLVADGQARHPPVVHVRVLEVSDGQPWKSAQARTCPPHHRAISRSLLPGPATDSHPDTATFMTC